MTDAEIAGIMGWRGPGAYTEASLRKIKRIIELVREECRAAPADLDAEGLPPLPDAISHASKGPSAFFMKWSGSAKELRGNIALYTANQVRQAQRDAIAAYCARVGMSMDTQKEK